MGRLDPAGTTSPAAALGGVRAELKRHAWGSLAALLGLIAAGVAVNILIGQIVRNVLGLPLYLDSIGTILSGALAGPVAGAATGALSNLLWSLLFADPSIAAYSITAACVGIAAWVAAQRGAFRSPWWAAVAGLLTGAMAALVSAPLSAYLTGGIRASGTDYLLQLLAGTSDNVLQAATLRGFIADPLDKLISFLVVWLLLRSLPERVLRQFRPAAPGAETHQVMSRYGLATVVSIAALAITWLFLPAFGRSVFAVFYLAVLLSAWRGGLGPGLLAMVVGAVANIVLVIPPIGSLGLQMEDWLRLCIFLTVSLLIALVTDALERARRALDVSLAQKRRSEAEMSSILDSVVEALALVAPDQMLIGVNRRFEELFGQRGEQVVGRRLDELRPLVERVFADPASFLGHAEVATDGPGGRFPSPLEQVWPQARQLDVFWTPVRSDGRFLGRLYGFRDVTQERELDRMKTEFVSQVSHELRTPLTAIKGFTDMLLDGDAGDLDEEQEEYLNIVKQNVDRLVSLINDLLDISRIESGRVKLQLESINLGAIVESVVTTMRPLVEGKSQTLAVAVEPALPLARGDHDRIVQVVTNLVSNAYKYTPTGGAIRVEAGRDGDLARIAVRDSGIGIAPEDVAQLFTRFFRVDSSLTREIGGTGLGLSIVKSIVEMHGGTVVVESEPDKGSTFSFTVPLAAATAPAGEAAGPADQGTAAPAAEPHQPEPRPAAPAAAERTILVVGEDATVEDYLRHHLDPAGYRVEPATSADAALEQIAALQPDLIALAVRLPDPRGLDDTRRLAEASEARDIPLLIVSLLQDEAPGAAPRAADAPARPIHPDHLLAQVQRALTVSAGRRVLVIEDDPSVRDLLATALRKQGFEALTAPDGETGLLLAEQEQPGLILLDLRLPGIDGFGVLQQLKRSPTTAAIPVIAVTGSEGLWLGARARVLALGAADFIAKPVELKLLIDEIRTLIGEEEADRVDTSVGRGR
ncbi:MAG TPA: response regulator [Chloroflexota bacterium]|jgi:signal transduction histidine kinase/DNA-binding response OmpR family regulator